MKLFHLCYHHTSLDTRKITQPGEESGVMEEVEGNTRISSKQSSIFQNMNRKRKSLTLMSYFVSPSAFQGSTEKGCVTGRKSSFKIRLKINLHFIRHILIGLRYSGAVLFTN